MAKLQDRILPLFSFLQPNYEILIPVNEKMFLIDYELQNNNIKQTLVNILNDLHITPKNISRKLITKELYRRTVKGPLIHYNVHIFIVACDNKDQQKFEQLLPLYVLLDKYKAQGIIYKSLLKIPSFLINPSDIEKVKL